MRIRKPVWAILAVALAACTTGKFQRTSFELIVEGEEANYPAFEAAARDCRYTAYQRFPGATVQSSITVGPHYNLSRVRSRTAACAIRWVESHPETGLRISGH